MKRSPIARTRNLLLALLSSSIAVNLVDRQTLSVVAPVMRADLHLTNTQYAYIATSIVLGVLVISGAMQIWMLYCFALALGFVRVFEMPARQTIISEIVSPDHLKNAISLNASVNNLARAIGPSIGALGH